MKMAMIINMLVDSIRIQNLMFLDIFCGLLRGSPVRVKAVWGP